jgi:NAD(P)-dependent dehydrogenase (short-subunit alcohol dehydrogenase family)
MDLYLSGKRAVITGGSRGIGFAIADALHGGRVLGLPADVNEGTAQVMLANGISIGRPVTAAELADVVVFLASPRSVAITGDTIAAGGGARGPIHY